MALPANPQVTACAPRRGWLARVPSADVVRRFDDITAFREVATPYLVRDEARHNLILGISSTLMQKPDLHPVFDLWVASDGDEVTGAALRTPPFNLVLAQPANDPALDALVDRRSPRAKTCPGSWPRSPRSRRSSARGRQATTWMRRSSSGTGSTSFAR